MADCKWQIDIFNLPSAISLPSKEVGKYQRCYNGGITFYYEFWGMDIQLAPGNFFIGHCAGIGAV